MQREETRQGMVPDLRAAHEQLLQPGSDHWREANQVERNLGGPVAFLIEWQEPTGDRHRHRQGHQQEEEPEAQVPGRRVGSIQD